jgi:hypothetical protein
MAQGETSFRAYLSPNLPIGAYYGGIIYLIGACLNNFNRHRDNRLKPATSSAPVTLLFILNDARELKQFRNDDSELTQFRIIR